MILAGLTTPFILGEIAFRAFFPEFHPHYHVAHAPLRIRKYFAPVFKGTMRVGNKNERVYLGEKDSVVLIFGDSVTEGLGLHNEDIYWKHWERQFHLEGFPVKIVSFFEFHFARDTDAIVDIIRDFQDNGISIDGVVYQFNFNDLIPYTKRDPNNPAESKSEKSVLTYFSEKTAALQYRFFRHSALYQVLVNKWASLNNNRDRPCESLDREGLGPYRYSYGAPGIEEKSEKIWNGLERGLIKVKNYINDVPFVILISPLSQHIDPEMKVDTLIHPFRLECGMIDPVKRLSEFSEQSGFHLVDPTEYMKKIFDRYVQEGKDQKFYFFNDGNHPNNRGHQYLAEYSYWKIFREGLITSKRTHPF